MKTIEYDERTHKVVPIIPTPKMVDATFMYSLNALSHNQRNKRVYEAMIAAAPAAPAQPVHNDHPMRHWDRTCPACIAQPAPDTDIDTLRRDALRYRLLRERSHSHYFAYRNYENGFNGSFSQASGTELDQYIDAAIAAMQAKGDANCEPN